MQKYEQLCAYVQSSEKKAGGDGYVTVDVRPSHINFAMYVKQTEKQQHAKWESLAETGSSQSLMNVLSMTARWHDDGWMEIASAAQRDNTSSQQAKHSQQLPNHQRKLPEVMKQHQGRSKGTAVNGQSNSPAFWE